MKTIFSNRDVEQNQLVELTAYRLARSINDSIRESIRDDVKEEMEHM